MAHSQTLTEQHHRWPALTPLDGIKAAAATAPQPLVATPVIIPTTVAGDNDVALGIKLGHIRPQTKVLDAVDPCLDRVEQRRRNLDPDRVLPRHDVRRDVDLRGRHVHRRQLFVVDPGPQGVEHRAKVHHGHDVLARQLADSRPCESGRVDADARDVLRRWHLRPWDQGALRAEVECFPGRR
ncbi:hypothetical protein PpBr36_02247 [Pyricularia pennisetigena]|uniref:hypothetical protein n=1 Tax=Pyricularia pennisetigena TaxID=1578925 RepID=UPI00114F5212|nr:hypothetical protein PpBr36_02247 [Pyricularia pennisetigena]TLS30037.1 hypothetical protein PpBr36_02247 [Pyricularia pennisetigena]